MRPRSASACLLIGAVLVALAPGTGRAASASPLPQVRVISDRPGCDDGSDPETPRGSQLETEPQIAVNPASPNNVVATWWQGGVVVASSMDTGATWTQTVPPGFAPCTQTTFPTDSYAVNESVSFGPPDANGHQTLYLTAAFAPSLEVALATGIVRIVVTTSTDGGMTWTGTPTIVDQSPIPGRNHEPTITADPRIPGRAYMIWDKQLGLAADNPLYFSRTDDAGAHWTAAVAVYQPPLGANAFHSTIRVLRDGTLLDVFLLDPTDPNDPATPPPVREMALRLTADGLPADPSTPDAVEIGITSRTGPVDPDTGVELGIAAAPSLDVAVDDSALVVWNDILTPAQSPTEGYRTTVWYSRSLDGGSTWSQPAPMVVEETQAFLPTVAVDGRGGIGVLYDNFSNDRRAPTDDELTTDVWLAQSTDGGMTWKRTHVAGPFNVRGEDDTVAYLGVMQGLSALPHGFASAFVQTTPQAAEGDQDIFFARLAHNDARRP